LLSVIELVLIATATVIAGCLLPYLLFRYKVSLPYTIFSVAAWVLAVALQSALVLLLLGPVLPRGEHYTLEKAVIYAIAGGFIAAICQTGAKLFIAHVIAREARDVDELNSYSFSAGYGVGVMETLLITASAILGTYSLLVLSVLLPLERFLATVFHIVTQMYLSYTTVRGEGARGFMAVVVSHGIVDALSILSQVSVLIEPALVTALLGLTYIALVAVDSFFYSEITRLRPLLTPARLRADISEEEFV